MNKNVLFVTFTMFNGVGGHYFTIRSLTKLSIFNKVRLLDIGYAESPIIKNYSNYSHYNLKLINPITYYKKLKSEIVGHDVIYCFDVHSYNVVRFLCDGSKKVIMVKCGGPNPTFYYPKVKNLIVFSQENYDFFLEKVAKISLIPNRVVLRELIDNQVVSNSFNLSFDKNILCIARIGVEYENKIKLAYKLFKELSKSENVSLTIIGVVQQSEYFDELKKSLHGNVYFYTDALYTNEASKYIMNFDYLIGTGRGAVESILLGKKTFVPINNNKELVEVTSRNFIFLSKENFSGRTQYDYRNLDLDNCGNTLFEIARDNYAVEFSNDKHMKFIKDAVYSKNSNFIGSVSGFLYLLYSSAREGSHFFRKVIYPFIKYFKG